MFGSVTLHLQMQASSLPRCHKIPPRGTVLMLAGCGRAANPLLKIPHLAGIMFLPYASPICELFARRLADQINKHIRRAEVKGRAVYLCRSEGARCLMLNNHM